MTDRINNLRELFFANEHKKYRVEDLGLSILNEETEKLPFAIRKAMAFDLALEKMNILTSSDAHYLENIGSAGGKINVVEQEIDKILSIL